MKYKRLGKSGLEVSDICMGTMTFGSSCDEKEAFKIMDKAFYAGIDFYDTAELYPIPPDAKWVGDTEIIVGKWLKTKPRDAIILATKVVGPGHGWFRAPMNSGKSSLDRRSIIKAIEGSLKKLQTDYIDLYQTHWPDHGMAYEETLSALEELIQAGKIRVIGCSNETSWGLMKSLQASEKFDLPRYNTVQNNFSLINRRCENELAQVCRMEGVSLLPYSPLGGGVLTGKYNSGTPENARFTKYLAGGKGMERQKKMAMRFVNERSIKTTKKLMEIAKELSISVTTLSVAWSKQHDFVASTIIGANTVEQLEESLLAIDLNLSCDVLEKINDIEEEIPNPMTEDGLRRL